MAKVKFPATIYVFKDDEGEFYVTTEDLTGIEDGTPVATYEYRTSNVLSVKTELV